MALRFVIQTGSTTPIYRQIADQVRQAVVAGQVSVEDPLPSVRALAEELVINPNTVARAYAELAREGLVDAHAGRGVVIARKRKMFTRTEGKRRLEPMLNALIGEAMVMDFTPEELREAFESKLAQWNTGKGGNTES
jgi:GntR family transcriptional regulator